ncbi:protein UXT [Populus alba x Populus x berolinensis]|nr:protein UXT [Populus alba x Populus x berolinensis]
MMDSNIQEKVHKVEEFFDGHLKPQLVRAIAERFVKEHRELREEQRTMVNLGSVLYMQADVPDTHRIFVDVGLGFHVEFTWKEVGVCQIILLFEHFAWPRLQLIGINPDEPLGGDAGIGLCFIVI